MTTQQEWLAAGASVVVTPPAGLPMGGYDERVGSSIGSADELEVNLLALGRGGRPEIAWVAIDSLAVTGPLRDAMAAAAGDLCGIDPARVLCFASHTHSAPSGWVGSIHPVLPAPIDSEAIGKVAQAIRGARPWRHPVSLETAETVIDGVGSNRHDVHGPHDRTSGILLLRRTDTAEPVALMYDFACHPTVLGPDNLRWSADWVGAARRRIRHRLGSGLPVLFQQGSAGDVSPRFHRRDRHLPEVQRLGGIVGDRVADAAVGAATRIRPDGLGFDRTTVRLPRRLPQTEIAAGTGRIVGHDRLASSLAEGERAGRALALADLPDEFELPISRVRLGDRRWLHLPVELFSSYGLELRSADPGVRVIGYTDGYAGYLADADAFAAGQYEASSSFFDLATSGRLVEACRDYLAAR